MKDFPEHTSVGLLNTASESINGRPSLKIAFVTRTPPNVGTGGGERSKSIYNALLLLGSVEIVWLRSSDDDVLNPLPCTIIDLPKRTWFGGRVDCYSGAEFRKSHYLHERFSEFCRRIQPDLIFCRFLDCLRVAPWEFAASMVDIDDFPWHLPIRSKHGLFHVYNFFRPYLYSKPLSNFKSVFVTKEADRRSLRHPSVRVLPCVTTQDITTTMTKGTERILFVGNLMHAPNASGLKWFIDRVLPKLRMAKPTIQLLVAGKHSELCPRVEGVQILGFIDKIADAYQQTDIVICPIHQGTGSTLKLAEAARAGKGIVATKIAVEGYSGILRPQIDLLVADSPQDFTLACERLLEDVRYRYELGKSAAGQAAAYLSQRWINTILAEEIGRLAHRPGGIMGQAGQNAAGMH